MNYLSICSGIEAASCAWHSLGWRPVGFSEIEPFPCAVLKYRFPHVQNFGDMTKFKEWKINDSIDVLVGGTPCQAFSVAGLRRGLADPRGNLTLVFLGMVEHFRPRWVIWENVPGVLSSTSGEPESAPPNRLGVGPGERVVDETEYDEAGALASFTAGLGELGYGWAFRVLDAQFFGVAQRRRRVFVVANSGAWQRSAAVLFEPESLRGDSSPSRETREDVTGTISSRTTGGGGLGTDFDLAGGLQTWPAEVAPTLNANFGDKMGLENQHALNGGGISSPAKCLTANNQRNDFETENLIPCTR